LEWYQKSANSGLIDAQTYLGVIYDKGRGTKQDDMEAIRWYQKAAERGYGQAQYNLGVFIFMAGELKSTKNGEKWFERARDSGFAKGSEALKELF